MDIIPDLGGIFSYVIGLCWDLLSFTVPGTGVTAKVFVTTLVVINVGLAALHFAFGLCKASGVGYRSGNGRKGTISKERQGDEK